MGATDGPGPMPHLAVTLGGMVLALPLARVRTVVRPPPLTELPLGPPEVAGLANLNGAVTVVIDLRPAFAMGTGGAVPDGQRVVALDQDPPAGLLVDRVLGVRPVDPGGLSQAGDGVGMPGEHLLAGLADRAGESLRVLDLGRVLGHVLAAGSRGPRRATRPPGPSEIAAPDDTAQRRRTFVSFESDGDEYAVPIAAVGEIVPLPPGLARVPHARGHVLGMATLRGRLATLVSARALLGLRPAEPGATAKVLLLPGEGGGAVGLVVDRPRGILAVGEGAVEPVPPFLERALAGGIEGICRLDGGTRLVAVIAPAALLGQAVGTGVPGMEETGMDAADQGVREEFVGFRLGAGAFGIPVADVEEVVRVPASLQPVPLAPPTIAGILTHRGQVLPVMDAHRRFGLPPNPEARHILVLSSQGRRYGLRVDAVTAVLKLPPAVIEPAPALAAMDLPVATRVARLDGRMVLLLSADRLAGPGELAALDLAAAGPGDEAA